MPILFVTVLIDLIGFGIVIPILPFLSPQLGADKFDIALIIVTYAAFAGLCGPGWGRLSDRIGRKPVIMICLAGAAVSYVMLGLASQLWMIYAARGFAGLMAGNFGVASAMMADITSPQQRARGMGLIGAAFGLGLVIGPVLGGLLSGPDNSFTLPCIVAGGMSLLAIIAAAVFLPESVNAQSRRRNRDLQASSPAQSVFSMLRETHNTFLVAQYTVHNTCVSSVGYLFPLWVGDYLGWSARQVGIVFGVQGIFMVIMQAGLIGPIAQRFGEIRFLRVGITVMLCGFLLAAIADSMPLMVATFFITITGATVCTPLLNTITSHRTPLQNRGRMMGTTASAASWGRVLGPLAAGINLQLFGYSAAWLFSACVATMFLSWAWSQHPVPTADTQSRPL
jgi:DHA1 family tetracycline resistance protein-like MFS transporter